MSEMDAFRRHEVLHMTAYLEHAIDEELCNHDQIKNNPARLALAEKACEALADLYQEIDVAYERMGTTSGTWRR